MRGGRTLGGWVALGIVLAGPPGCGPPSSAGAPNLLLVTVDTLRADHTSLYGYARPTTPRLERLAEQGTRFERAYAPMSTTGPTHASLFTGLHPIQHGVVKNGLELGARYQTLAELLAERGYETGAVVSSFALDARFGYAQGFGAYDDRFEPGSSTIRARRWEGFDVEHGFDRRADDTTRRAVAWLREARSASRPFFLFVHYFDPHSPYDPPPAFRTRLAPVQEHPSLVEESIALYDGEVAFADEELGRLLDALEEDGLAERTLVVVTSDHGEGLMTHGSMLHGVHIYEEQVRVPLVLRWPARIEARGLRGGPVQLVDLPSTLLALLGLEAPDPPLPGRSFAGVVLGEASLDPETPIYLQRRPFRKQVVADRWGGRVPVDGEQFAILRGVWKYIEGPQAATRELYDLGSDPLESRDLASDQPERLAELAAQLRAWRQSHDAAARTVPPISEENRAALEALGYTE